MFECIPLLVQSNLLVFLSIIGALGISVGSFLNVVIYRLPIMLERQWTAVSLQGTGENAATHLKRFNLILPSSHCPQCKKPLSVFHNIPLFSYLF